MVAEAAIAAPSVRTFKTFFIFLFLPLCRLEQRPKTYPKIELQPPKSQVEVTPLPGFGL
jgi:hypothetical protein